VKKLIKLGESNRLRKVRFFAKNILYRINRIGK